MLNYIWLALVLAAVLIGGATGNLKALTDGAFEATRTAVLDTAFPLIGYMALWLGIMRLAEKSGLVQVLARALRPLLRLLFPEVPAEDPAMGAMVMNMAANMLGLGNSATPLGLKAMQRLEKLNPHPGTATNAMCTFLAINTSSIQLIPATAVGIMAAAKSTDPTAIIGTSLIATTCAAISAVIAVKFLQRLPIFAAPAVTTPIDSKATPDAVAPAENDINSPPPRPLPAWGYAVLILFCACFAWWFIRDTFIANLTPAAAATSPATSANPSLRAISSISILAIPFFLSFFPLYAFLRGIKVYEEFIEGAKEGFHTAIRIIPYLIAILVAVGMFRTAGGIQMIANALGPVLDRIGFPADLLPIVFVRPLSGGATIGLFRELVAAHGPDTFISRTAGTILGSTETTFYVLALYFGSVGIRRTRHAVLAGLTADTIGVIVSFIICRLMFSGS